MLPIYATASEGLAAYTGSAEDIEAIQQFARDYDWDGPITDPEFAADVALGTLCVDARDFDVVLHTEAAAKLFAALVDSAAKVK